VGGLLAELEDDIDHDRFKRLLHYSRRLAAFQNRARLVQGALEEVLEQDEDLQAMYLSERKAGKRAGFGGGGEEDHEELEVLLESFEKQVEEIVNEAEVIMSNVQSTQEIVELILDSNRNQLLALDLKVRARPPCEPEGCFGGSCGLLRMRRCRSARWASAWARSSRGYSA
jgi:magnesium transporter